MSIRGNGDISGIVDISGIATADSAIGSFKSQTIIVCFESTGCKLPFGGAIELQGEATTARFQFIRHLCMRIVKVISF